MAARYAGRTLDDFRYLAPDVTQSTFGDTSVIANWQQSAAYVTAGSGVVPGGYLAQAADGSILAGSFSGSFNGAPLTAGEHDIVMRSTAQATVVYQPTGADTALVVAPPAGWQAGGVLSVTAAASDGSTSGNVDFTVTDTGVSFNWTRTFHGQPVDSYQILAQ